MKDWTVVGLDESTGEVFAATARAESSYDAIGTVATEVHEQGWADDLIILGAYRGLSRFETPGDDNGKSAYAVDLRALSVENGDVWYNERNERKD
jgi:hypothetical protein